VGDVVYTWDARGNLTNDGVFTYTYNSAGRLVRAESVAATLVYTYTADGLRVAQSVDGAVTSFAWDWASGVPELLSDGDALYLVGLDTLGQREGGAWAYYLPDALGSVRQTVDGAGAVVRAREWSPYGVEIGGAQAGLGYTGEWFDDGMGMVYLRARWYSPGDGIFTSRDPVEGEPAYQYTWCNPINGIDPSGYMVFPWDVGRRQFYSCKCGWIDKAHASSKLSLIEDILAIRNSPHIWARLHSSTSSGRGPLARTVSADFLVRRQGVWGEDAYEIALGIMIAWENFFEAAQGYGFYALTQSSFSEEDLVSDLIGFHRGYNEKHGLPSSLEHFMKKCGVVGYEYYDSSSPEYDQDKFLKIQQAVYTEYITENGSFGKFYQWGIRPPGRWCGSLSVVGDAVVSLDPRYRTEYYLPDVFMCHT